MTSKRTLIDELKKASNKVKAKVVICGRRVYQKFPNMMEITYNKKSRFCREFFFSIYQKKISTVFLDQDTNEILNGSFIMGHLL